MTERATTRRRFVLGTAGAVVSIATMPLPVAATPASMADAMRTSFGDRTIQEGRLTLGIPALAENGNSVQMTIDVESPMTADDYVRSISVFSEKNPLPQVATYRFSPAAGRARIATRIRLSASQTITAIAEMSDGSLWSGSTKTIVTLAACIGPLP